MATNKHAIIRYQALNQCFQNPGRNYFIDDLVDVCNDALTEVDPNTSGIRKRQVYDDINFMKDSRGYNAPIESFKVGRRVYYRYRDSDFSINSQPINEQEAQQLKETLLTLSRFKGMPQFEWVEEMIARLSSSFNLEHSDNQIIEFEQNPYLKGLNFISELYDAISYKKVLEIKYQGFKQENEVTQKIHPYYLKQYNNRWFLFGLNDEYNNLSNLALDRIHSIEETQLKYKETEIDFEEFFEDIVGVSQMEGNVEKIVLRIENSLWPYIKTKPIHGSQKIVEMTDEFTDISIEVIPNYELESQLMQYGEKIEVLGPMSFRVAFKQRVIKLNKKYN